VYPNVKRDVGYVYTQRVAEFFAARGVKVYATEETVCGLAKELPVRIIEDHEKQDMDVAIVLGGDGSMIQGAHFMLGTTVPILGINLGTLGYLTEVEVQELDDSLRRVIKSDFRVEQRMMLEAEVQVAGQKGSRVFYAVNDLVLHRNLLDGILTVKTYINGASLADFRADGVIVSTPCGSTAYNFSAGGPIVNPVADNIILTPLSSHSALDRSIILMGQDRLSFQIGATGKSLESVFSADGVDHVSLGEGSWIHVKKSEYTFPLARLLQRSFYEVLQMKL
jgi:NAD+ kinase